MKKTIYVGMTGLLIFLLSASAVFSQTEKEIVLKKQAQAEVAADSDQYIIGAEDVLYIHVWKEEILSRNVTVRMDGKISIPLVNEIQASGLTPFQLKEALTQKLQELIETPNVSVIVMEANSFKVYISGQIKTPGVYRLKSETSIAQIISMAGGFTDWANQKKIIVIRKESGKEKRFTVNYKKIINGKDPASNIALKTGDTIIVP